jgi:hypothetical protein
MEEITLLLIADNFFINAFCPESSFFSIFVLGIVKGQILLKAIQEMGRKLKLRDRYSTGNIDMNRFQILFSIFYSAFLFSIFILHVCSACLFCISMPRDPEICRNFSKGTVHLFICRFEGWWKF